MPHLFLKSLIYAVQHATVKMSPVLLLLYYYYYSYCSVLLLLYYCFEYNSRLTEAEALQRWPSNTKGGRSEHFDMPPSSPLVQM